MSDKNHLPKSSSAVPGGSHGHHKTKGAFGKGSKRNLVALGSVAVMAIYGAGFYRTLDASRQFESEGRRHQAPQDETSADLPGSNASRSVPASNAAALPTPTPAAVVTAVLSAMAPGEKVTPSATPPTPTALIRNTAPKTSPVAAAPAQVIVPVVADAPSGDQSLPVKKAVTPAPTTLSDAALAAAAKANWKDGTFSGWGHCRHGELEVTIVIKDGKITECSISQCFTQYSKNVIAALPKRAILRQSANVDWIGGATDSSDAFYYAISEAMRVAK